MPSGGVWTFLLDVRPRMEQEKKIAGEALVSGMMYGKRGKDGTE